MTVRSSTELDDLLADNTAGDISALDLRDFKESVYPVIVGCEVSRTTNQTVANNSVDFVDWETEVRDDGGCFNPASPTRFTAPVTGYYIVSFFVEWVNTEFTDDLAYYGIHRDGSQVTYHTRMHATTQASERRQLTTQVIYLAATSYIQCRVQQVTGSDADIDNAWGSFALLNAPVGTL